MEITYVCGVIGLVMVMAFVTVAVIFGELSGEDLMLVVLIVLQIIGSWFGVTVGYRIATELGKRVESK